MNNFQYNTQTAMYFGHNCIENNAELFKTYGKRAVIFTSKFAEGFVNLALVDVEKVFNDLGIEYLILDGVKEDPPVDVVVALAKEAAKFNADFFFAVGGGSSIDTSKAVAMLVENPDVEDPYEVFYGLGAFAKTIKSAIKTPIFAVPTTAGTGAEVSQFAVLTRADTHTKLSVYPCCFCEAAFLDSRYIKSAPIGLFYSGVIDALAHGVETHLHVGSNPLNRMLAENGFKLFNQFKGRMIKQELTDEDYDSIQLASFVQGMAFMQSSTTIPHGMGYPLSHIKHVGHGLANGIFLGEYIKGFKDQSLVQPIVEMCGFKNSEDFCWFCKQITEDYVDIEVSEEEIQQWTDDFMAVPWRLTSNPEPVTREMIENLYKKSLARYIK